MHRGFDTADQMFLFANGIKLGMRGISKDTSKYGSMFDCYSRQLATKVNRKMRKFNDSKVVL